MTLGSPSGQVAIQGERVLVSNLKLDAFDGPVAGDTHYLGGGKLEGELSWTKLSIPDLTSAYGFQMKGGGEVTGRINFSLSDNKVETMSGTACSPWKMRSCSPCRCSARSPRWSAAC